MLGKKLFVALLALGILSAASVAIVAVSAPQSFAQSNPPPPAGNNN